MKLYTYDPAPNPMRLGLFLRYKGISIPTQQVNLRSMEQFSDAYRAVNPDCTVPTLVLDGGTILTDVIAICWLLEQQHPDKPLMGTDALSQAQVLSWDHVIFVDGISSVADALRNSHPAFAERALPGPLSLPQLPALADRGRVRLHDFWKRLDQHLRGRDFIVGKGLTLADIDAFACIQFAGWIKDAPAQELVALGSWYERMKQQFPDVGASTRR